MSFYTWKFCQIHNVKWDIQIIPELPNTNNLQIDKIKDQKFLKCLITNIDRISYRLQEIHTKDPSNEKVSQFFNCIAKAVNETCKAIPFGHPTPPESKTFPLPVSKAFVDTQQDRVQLWLNGFKELQNHLRKIVTSN